MRWNSQNQSFLLWENTKKIPIQTFTWNDNLIFIHISDALRVNHHKFGLHNIFEIIYRPTNLVRQNNQIKVLKINIFLESFPKSPQSDSHKFPNEPELKEREKSIELEVVQGCTSGVVRALAPGLSTDRDPNAFCIRSKTLCDLKPQIKTKSAHSTATSTFNI